jgi:hypothetical protein
MMLATLTVFVVPVLYCGIAELSLRSKHFAKKMAHSSD